MKWSSPPALITLLLLMLVAGCGGAETGTSPASSFSTPEPTATPSAAATPSSALPPATVEQPRVQAAISDLANRLSADAAAVEIAEYAEVTWPDGAMGCPQEGMSYTQATVPGNRLLLTSSGKTYAYHAAEGGDFFYCEVPNPPVSADN